MNIIEITDLNSEALQMYSQVSEKMLAHYNEPKEGFFVAESPNVIKRALAVGYEPVSFLLEKSQLRGEAEALISGYSKVPVYVAEEGVLKNIIGYQLTRGVLCLMQRKAMSDAMELSDEFRRIAVLEDVMNPTNVGAIFRSAAALGVEAVLLTKGCSDPLYRRAARVSMGTVFQIPWTWIESETWMAQLQAQGYKTVAMALRDDSVSIDDPVLKVVEKMAIVLGTEGEGLKSSTIENSDYTVRIPMYHEVDSLNVAAASAVAFWELCKK